MGAPATVAIEKALLRDLRKRLGRMWATGDPNALAGAWFAQYFIRSYMAGALKVRKLSNDTPQAKREYLHLLGPTPMEIAPYSLSGENATPIAYDGDNRPTLQGTIAAGKPLADRLVQEVRRLYSAGQDRGRQLQGLDMTRKGNRHEESRYAGAGRATHGVRGVPDGQPVRNGKGTGRAVKGQRQDTRSGEAGSVDGRAIRLPAGSDEVVTRNVFCPTGKGGGVDPSCKKGSSANVDLYDTSTGEILWSGPREEGEAMLKAQTEEVGPDHGVGIRDADDEARDKQEKERERLARERDEQVWKRAEAEKLKSGHGLLPGHPEYVKPPERLYHATFAAEQIKAEGIKSADDVGGQVLGGSATHLVSFTTKDNAEWYRDALNVARRGARGELTDADLIQQGAKYGVDAATVRKLLREAPQEPDRRAFSVLQRVSIEGRKFPLFMGSTWPKAMKTAPEASVVSIKADDAKEIHYNPGETEWRVKPYKGLTVNEDCGTGKGGFKPGNTCSQGRWSSSGKAVKPGKVNRASGVEDAARKLFKRSVSDDELAAVGFSPEGTEVRVRGNGSEITFYTESEGTVLSEGKQLPELSCSRKIKKPWFGPLTCYNQSIKIPKEGRYGSQGLDLFDRQVKALQGLGVKRIVASAAGDPNDPDSGAGFYVWPRYGFSGTMSSKQIQALPAGIRSALNGKRDIRDLFDLPGGAEAWQKYGSSIKVHFDLSPGSRNLRALEAYKQQRANKSAQVANEEVGTINDGIVTHGGPGSGNFGHAGRPGKVGGSSPRESTPARKEVTLPKVGERVKVGGATYVAEHFDNDDTFPPAIASYEIKDGAIFYTGRNGSEGVVTGTKAESEKWMADVRKWVEQDPPEQYRQRPWTPEDGGKENVERAKEMVKRVTTVFGIPPLKVETSVATKAIEGGSFSTDSVNLVNPHKNTPAAGLNFPTQVSSEQHIAAHEAMHSVFSRNPTLGRKLVEELRGVKEEVSLYHGLAGHFEGLIDLGAAYIHSPNELKQYSPKLYELADRWKREFRGET